MEKDFFELSPESRTALTLEARSRNEPLRARWNELDPDFGQAWRWRAEAAAKHIGPKASVVDLGCGAMVLENYLAPTQTYLPADLCRRDARTIILDLNAELDRLPDGDCGVLLGVLEYVYAPDALLAALHRRYRQVVLSFNILHRSRGIEARLASGWVNHFTLTELKRRLRKTGFAIRRAHRVGRREEYIFDLRSRAPRSARRPLATARPFQRVAQGFARLLPGGSKRRP